MRANISPPPIPPQGIPGIYSQISSMSSSSFAERHSGLAHFQVNVPSKGSSTENLHSDWYSKRGHFITSFSACCEHETSAIPSALLAKTRRTHDLMLVALQNHKCHSKRQNTSRVSRVQKPRLVVLDVLRSHFADALGNESSQGEAVPHHPESYLRRRDAMPPCPLR